MNVINSFDGEYEFLSNFYPCTFTYQGLTFQNSEACYQSMKTLDLEDRKRFQGYGPKESKKEGRKLKLRSDWDLVKLSIMEEILEAKFMQNPHLSILLSDTGKARLIEGNYWGDTYWGMTDKGGENHLGKLLMELRLKFQEVL